MAVSCPRQLCARAQGSYESAIPCGDCESRPSNSKPSIVSFASAEFFWILEGDNVVKSQIAFYGIQEANGFELLRLLRREFSLMSRPEALQYREACLKYTVKKSERHLLMDVLLLKTLTTKSW